MGIWVETTEGAKFWPRVINELRSWGVEDVLIVVCDGLTGLPAAVTACWSQTIVQTCVVHLTRAPLRWLNYKDRKRVCVELRKIYGAVSEQAARDALDAWTDSDVGKQYPSWVWFRCACCSFPDRGRHGFSRAPGARSSPRSVRSRGRSW